MDFLVESINYLIQLVASLISIIIGIFPDSPFLGLENSIPDNVVMSYITWFIPFPAMLVNFTTFLGALIIYYVVRIAARWLKMIRS